MCGVVSGQREEERLKQKLNVISQGVLEPRVVDRPEKLEGVSFTSYCRNGTNCGGERKNFNIVNCVHLHMYSFVRMYDIHTYTSKREKQIKSNAIKYGKVVLKMEWQCSGC